MFGNAYFGSFDAREFRAGIELVRAQAFDERAARDEDARALAGEHEDKVTFLREFDAWLDGRRDLPPDPTPDTLHYRHAPEPTL